MPTKEYKRQWYLANRERVIAKAKEAYAANPQKGIERSRRWRQNNPERAKELARQHARRRRGLGLTQESDRASKLKAYGLTPAAFAAMLQVQENKCALCDSTLTVPYIDHNHQTGAVRGLLCAGCNTAIGHFECRILPRIDRVASYLKGKAE